MTTQAIPTPSPMRRVIGIDPGLTGGVAALDVFESGRIACSAFEPTPTLPAMRNRKLGTDFDVRGMYTLLRRLVANSPQGLCIVVLERASTRPGQHASSVLRTGEGFGLWRGLVAALDVRVQYVTPKTWKTRAQLLHADKKASVLRAKERFPELAELRASQHGIAEAALIAVMGTVT